MKLQCWTCGDLLPKQDLACSMRVCWAAPEQYLMVIHSQVKTLLTDLSVATMNIAFHHL